MKNQRKAYIFALTTILFWSTMSSAFKLSLNHISVEGLLFWAIFFAVIVLAATVFFMGKHNHLSNLSVRDIGRSALMGFINPFLYYLVLFEAYNLLQAQEAGVLNYSWPVVLVVMSVLILKQRIGAKGFAGILVSFSGLLFISTKGAISTLSFSNPIGVLLALGSAFLWAVYWILNMKDKRESISKLFLNMLFGLAFITVYVLLTESIQIPSAMGFTGAIYIGTFEMGITFVFWLNALNYAENTAKVSNLIFLSPFLALLFVRFFVGEMILPSTFIGLLLISAGILLQQITFKAFKLTSNKK
jgi:drug/metabolite transporter (DMT)-like permease